MKKSLLFLLLLSLTASLSAAEEFEGPLTEPLPYEDIEFPSWAHDVRRFEVIFFGSVPLTYIITNLTYDMTIYASNNFKSDYSMGTQREQDDIQFMLLSSVSISAGIAVLDYIIGQVKEWREDKTFSSEQEIKKKQES